MRYASSQPRIRSALYVNGSSLRSSIAAMASSRTESSSWSRSRWAGEIISTSHSSLSLIAIALGNLIEWDGLSRPLPPQPDDDVGLVLGHPVRVSEQLALRGRDVRPLDGHGRLLRRVPAASRVARHDLSAHGCYQY